MVEQNTELRIQRASEDISKLLEDPAVSGRLEDDTRALLAENPELLKSGWYPGKRAVEEIEGIVRPLAQIPGKVEQTASSAVHDAVESTLGELGKIVKTLERYVGYIEGGVSTVAGVVARGIAREAIEPLEKKLADIAKQIVEQLPLASFIEFMLTSAEEYERRIGYVVNSLQRLEWALEGVDLNKKPRLDFKLKSLVTIVEELLQWLWKQTLPYALLSIISDPSLRNIISKFFPISDYHPDFLYVWLSEPGIDPEEREFRKLLVASIDKFVRDQRSPDGQLAIPVGSDAKTAVNLLSEFFSVVFSTIGGFAFKHPKVPSLTLPKLHWTSPAQPLRRPFDRAAVVSTGVSRSISYAVKGTVGTIGRGVWEVNVYNDAIVEGVASALSGFIGALIQTILHDLFWLLEIREVYEAERDAKAKSHVLLDSWPAVPEGADQDGPAVYWAVFLRDGMVPPKLGELLTKVIKAGESEASEVRGAVQSYTAYLDGIRDYSDAEIGHTDETVKIDSASKANVGVSYTCSADPDRVPVIRAYCHGAVSVMTPDEATSKGGRSYHCELKPQPPAGATLYVRSNWGGSDHCEIANV